MPFGIGITELLIILAILLVIFGPKRLPALGRQLGGGLREFRDSIRKRDEDDDEHKPKLSAAEQAPASPSGTPVTEEKSPLDGEVVRERT